MTTDRSIDRIVEEVIARLGEREPGGENLDGRSCTLCMTRGPCAAICPVSTTALVDAGASRLSHAPGATEPMKRDIAGLIDHTVLKADTDQAVVDRIVAEAGEYSFASVCVNPTWVKRCAAALAGTGVKVCTVIGFPLGANSTETKAFEARRACYDGATELDMVINVGALKSGDTDRVERDIRAVVESAGPRVIVKVIIETAYLTNEEKVKACEAAKRAGAHFVKTSTGFGPAGATVEDIRLMRDVVGTKMGVKASGGIKTREDADNMVRAGASRIGASASVSIAKGE